MMTFGGADRRGHAGGIGHRHPVARSEYPAAFGPRHLVLAEQELDAPRVLGDDIEFPLHHPG